MFIEKDISKSKLKICTRCIYDERISSIKFDSKGICNFCKDIDSLSNKFGTGKKKGKLLLEKIISDIKKDRGRKKYDCIVGVSGGTDSSFLVYLAKKWGLKPLAVHYDNTWNSAIATMNIHNVLKKLDIDLYTHVVSNKEMDDIFRSFFIAGVAEIEAPTDLAFAFLLRKVASKYRIKYILEGHSFTEEGITPLSNNYFDGKYIKSIHKKYGRFKIDTYPLMTFKSFLKSILFDRVKFIRPLWYIKYSKEETKEFLEKNFKWKDYGGHHLENRMSAFFHSIYLPQKFNTDMRNNTLAAKVRNNYITREIAWKEYNSKPYIENDLVNYFKKRLEITEEEYQNKMNEKPNNWTEFKTYKKRFELLRPFFKILANANFVPYSFYKKYCFPFKAYKKN